MGPEEFNSGYGWVVESGGGRAVFLEISELTDVFAEQQVDAFHPPV